MKVLENYLSKGFFTFAQNTSTTDYLRIAYLQALCVKYTQKRFSSYTVAITPGMKVPDKYRRVFDHVVEIPWGDDAEGEDWKLCNEWKAIYLSPYEMTLKLDSDLLFFKDLEPWWYLYSHYDLVPATTILDYKGNVSQSMYYRKEVVENELPNFYSALFYFRKCDKAFELFDTAQVIFKEWEEKLQPLMYKEEDLRRNHATTDIVFALASKVLGLHYPTEFSRFVHMKKEVQGITSLELDENWTKSLTYYFDKNLNLYIENFRQSAPVHYHVKDFVTHQLITKYEKALGL